MHPGNSQQCFPHLQNKEDTLFNTLFFCGTGAASTTLPTLTKKSVLYLILILLIFLVSKKLRAPVSWRDIGCSAYHIRFRSLDTPLLGVSRCPLTWISKFFLAISSSTVGKSSTLYLKSPKKNPPPWPSQQRHRT